jgi:hypothetical protein
MRKSPSPVGWVHGYFRDISVNDNQRVMGVLMTIREQFVEHFIVLLNKELLERLPCKCITTKMLLKAGEITNNLITHTISAIHTETKDEHRKDN